MLDIGVMGLLACTFGLFYGFVHWCGRVVDREGEETR
ncbi:hypothetical protein DFQ01_10689 [Paenibacillus cellulosilyticus]|uniref:Uncharacterized protein n=1 Tax=Paenibacillus cellulosilyticus TaxID=375489 RepID=A0A2V2YUT8_9BACL|nr:hypothetical protein DFQ01_10689 [Paenibacillus cellulosilyticus]